MKKYGIRFLIFISALILLFLSEVLFQSIEKEIKKPLRLSFSLPFPESVRVQFNLTNLQELSVESVYITGFFSEWNPKDERYRLELMGDNRWEIELPFDEGDNQYKFVVYINGLEKPVWSHDPHAKIQIDDSFNGYNSVIRVFSLKPVAFIVRAIILGLIGIFILFSLIEPLIRFILKLGKPFRIKLVLSMVLVISLSNAAFIFYNRYENKQLAKETFIECVSIIHNFLISEGVDFKKLESKTVIDRLRAGLKKVFWNLRSRGEKSKISLSQSMLIDICVFDTDFKPIACQYRAENESLVISYSVSYGLSVAEYYRRGIFGLAIDLYKKNNDSSKTPYFSKVDPYYINNREYQAAMDDMGYSVMLYPIWDNNRHIGYYGINLMPNVYKNTLDNILYFNLYLILISLILAWVLLSNIGNIVTQYLEDLIEWTKAIVSGNFRYERTIDTHDELQTLSENFNRMRISLESNLRNLKLINLITTKLQTIKNRSELYFVLLTFLTAGFGFGYNRSAVFLRAGDKLIGRYAIGYMDESEIVRKFGSIENYGKLMIEPDDFLVNYKKYMIMEKSEFLSKIQKTYIDKQDESLFWEALENPKTILVSPETPLESLTEKSIVQDFHLESFLLLPIISGDKALGILLLDNYFQKTPITIEHINQLQIVMNEFSVALENTSLVENLEKTVMERTYELDQTLSIMRQEMRLAKNIQKKMLPLTLNHLSELEANVEYQPISDIGGDIYDIVEINPFYYRVFLADATGHGVQAGLITMIIKAEYEKLKNVIQNPSELLEYLNNEFMTVYKQLTLFFTAVVIDINLKENYLLYANAGHITQYYLSENEVTPLSTSGKMVGIAENSRYKQQKLPIIEDFKLFLFTDGLTEEFNSQKEQYGEKRLLHLLSKNKELPTKDLLKTALKDMKNFIGNNPMNDDLTILVIERVKK